MKRQRTKEQAQLISKLNAYIIPIFGFIFLYFAINQREDQVMAGMLILIAVFLLGYGLFRIYLIKKLMKDVDGISEEELEDLQSCNEE